MKLKEMILWCYKNFSRQLNEKTGLNSKKGDMFAKTTDTTLQETRKKNFLKYKKFKSIPEVAQFQQEATNLIIAHLEESDYKTHQALIREVKFLLHYLFEVLKDDYFLGGKFFTARMTRIDDYIFSQYNQEEALKQNISKLRILASSNRFDENPRKNILSYFVFLEETGFEIITLLNDFYSMLDKSQKSLPIFKWGPNKIFKLSKIYKKEEVQIDPQSEVFTFLSQQTMGFSPMNAQRQILDEMIKKDEESR